MVKVRTLNTAFDRVVYGESSDQETEYAEMKRLLEVQDERINDVVNWIQQQTVPEYTTTERNALSSTHDGQIIYNSTTNRFELRQNGAWKYITNVSSA